MKLNVNIDYQIERFKIMRGRDKGIIYETRSRSERASDRDREKERDTIITRDKSYKLWSLLRPALLGITLRLTRLISALNFQ
jgi:hypothetical protein